MATLRYVFDSCEMIKYSMSQLKTGWTEETCVKVDALTQEDHTHVATRDERGRYRGHWGFIHHNPGINTAATRQREDNFSICVIISSRENRSRHQW